MPLLFGNPQYAAGQWLFGDPTATTPVAFTGTAAPSALRLMAVCAGAARDPGGFLENDTDENGNPFSYTLVSGVSNGTLNTYLGGAFEYTPNPGFIGFDQFTYRAHAGCVAGNVATVTISVEGSFDGTAAAAVLPVSGPVAVPAFGFGPVAPSSTLPWFAAPPANSFGQAFIGVAGAAVLPVTGPAGVPAFGFDPVAPSVVLGLGAAVPVLAAGYALTPLSATLRLGSAAGLLDLGGASPSVVYHPITTPMTDTEYLR